MFFSSFGFYKYSCVLETNVDHVRENTLSNSCILKLSGSSQAAVVLHRLSDSSPASPLPVIQSVAVPRGDEKLARVQPPRAAAAASALPPKRACRWLSQLLVLGSYDWHVMPWEAEKLVKMVPFLQSNQVEHTQTMILSPPEFGVECPVWLEPSGQSYLGLVDESEVRWNNSLPVTVIPQSA